MNRFTKESLIELFQQPLPGEAAHLELSPYRAVTSEALKTAEKVRLSAVAILLFHIDGILQTLVIQRQVYDGTHSGQISFPGGKWETTDETLVKTALRECEEEIGIHETELTLLGKLTDVFIPVSTFLVEPYVFYWNDYHGTYIPSEREVAAIHTFAIEQLFLPDAIQSFDIHLPSGMTIKDVPHFCVGDLRIWGATALIINELKKLMEDSISKLTREV